MCVWNQQAILPVLFSVVCDLDSSLDVSVLSLFFIASFTTTDREIFRNILLFYSLSNSLSLFDFPFLPWTVFMQSLFS